MLKVRKPCGASEFAKGWLTRHESGTYVRFTEAGAAMFA
jgi:hypothetical protein